MSYEMVGTWVCDNCFNPMEVEEIERNYNRVYCPVCFTEWHVDDNGEYINE